MLLIINLSATFFRYASTMLKSFIHLSLLISTFLKAITSNNLMYDIINKIFLFSFEVPMSFGKAENDL